MMRTAGLLCCAGAAASLAPAPTRPHLAQQWTATEALQMVTDQGGVSDGDVECCELASPQCKVQTQFQKGHHYFDQTNQRTRSGRAGAKTALVSLYAEKKEAQVDETNTCTSYCPLPSKLGRFHIDVNSTYGGATTVDGVAADLWTYTQYLFPKWHLSPMQVTNFYVSSGSDPATPLKQVDILQPLGQHIGTQNETWTEFAVGAPDASLFEVKGLKGCPVDQNCQQSERVVHRHRFGDVANQALHATATAVAAARTTPVKDPPTRPKFPQQWSALENEYLLINQGGEQQGDYRVCCSLGAVQCKIQSGHQSGQFYFDGPNNRTRSGDAGAATAIVDDYALGREMQVDENNTCTAYCPLDGTLGHFGISSDATYVGAGDVDGTPADMWKFTEYATKLHLEPMQITTFFVSKDATPLKEQDIIEPLGKLLGTENTTWIDFKAGVPPASLFTVPNAKTCPKDQNCQQNQARLAHRRRAARWTF